MKRALVALLALVVMCASMYYLGASHVQKKWNEERARLETAAAINAKIDKAAREEVQRQHNKEINYAKSQAGRAAINRWLHEHGLLPDGTKMPKPSSPETESAKGANGTASQCRTGGGIESFAERCAEDALKVESWQNWAIRENLEVE